MNKICVSLLAVAALSCRAWGQKVEVQKPDGGQIVHVETALNHLTVVEMSEPVVTVAVGSSAFKVEWRDKKNFIQPPQNNLRTTPFRLAASGAPDIQN